MWYTVKMITESKKRIALFKVKFVPVRSSLQHNTNYELINLGKELSK